MKKVYITGHGLMAADKNADGLFLKHRLQTYCADNKMLEGGVGSTGIVDSGEYEPKFDSAKADAKPQTFASGETVAMHYAYGGTSTIGDFKNSTKLDAAKKASGGLHGNKVQLGNSAGELFKLTEEEYLYCTARGALTGLNKIQDEIDVKLFEQEYEFHWVACRSHIPAGSDSELVKYVQDNGADGDGVTKIVR